MFNRFRWQLLGGSIFIAIALLVLLRAPSIRDRLAWRIDRTMTYLRGVIDPVQPPPTPLPPPQVTTISRLPTASGADLSVPQPSPSPTPPVSPTPIPSQVTLTSPAWERQDINNCGPAALAMYLRFFGWEGDQFDIANLLKPQRDDRNVNVEELAYYVRTRAGWLQIEYRVGGNLSLLKQILALGIPVMIEESFYFDSPFYPNDDLWAAHYNLLTGYDDLTQTFISQDSYHGANLSVSYQQVEEYWQPFNHVYMLVYPPQFQQQIQAVLGEDWDVTQNRQRALEATQHETKANSQNAFSWFNLGTNLVYFERYADAALAYDQARQLGLPQRMYRYQFGPFFAYFHSGRLDDLMAIVDYALKRTPNSEEALLWRGWAYYRKGDLNAAIADFRAALEQNPNYQDAQYALDFVLHNP
ncbi:MAG: tetratricopeptide repeat protein [Chloroflexota bacterium]